MNLNCDLESDLANQKEYFASQEEEIKDNLEEPPKKVRRSQGSNQGLIDSFESEIDDDEGPSEQHEISFGDRQVSFSKDQEEQKQAAPAHQEELKRAVQLDQEEQKQAAPAHQEEQKQAAPVQAKPRLIQTNGYVSLVNVVDDESSSGSDPFASSNQSSHPSD